MFLVVFGSVVGLVTTGVDLVSTRAGDLPPIFKKLEISSKDIIYDLGSGYGNVVFFAEKKIGASAVGLESIFWLYVFCLIKKRLLGSNAKFIHGNFFKHDWASATVLYAYLHPSVMAGVEGKFYKECKPGSLAIIGGFPFPKARPKHIFKTRGIRKFYVYQVERGDDSFNTRQPASFRGL